MLDRKLRKGQHEIVGFVLIVLLVSVIGVVFLSIALNKGSAIEPRSAEISNFLSSMMYTTTDCAINYVPQYRDMQDLIKECYKDSLGNKRSCLDGRNVCRVLEENLINLIDKSMPVGEEAVQKAYNFAAFYSSRQETIPDESIINLNKGSFKNCSSVAGSGHSLPVSSLGGGTIDVKLSICKN